MLMYKGFRSENSARRFMAGSLTLGTPLGWLLNYDETTLGVVSDNGECPLATRRTAPSGTGIYSNEWTSDNIASLVTLSLCVATGLSGAREFGKYVVSFDKDELDKKPDELQYAHRSCDMHYMHGGIVNSAALTQEQRNADFFSNAIYKSYEYHSQLEHRYSIRVGDHDTGWVASLLTNEVVYELRNAYNRVESPVKDQHDNILERAGIRREVEDGRNVLYSYDGESRFDTGTVIGIGQMNSVKLIICTNGGNDNGE